MVMLFAVAVAISVDPLAGIFAFFALLAATNPQRVVQMFYALDDAVQRAQQLIEERRWPALTSGSDEGETGAGEGVTTLHIHKEEAAVVTPTPTAPVANVATSAAVTPTAPTVTTPRIYNIESSVATLPSPSRFDPNNPRPARFAVPLGRDQTGAFRWLDFSKDALHIGLYGTSGCGKDHLLRLWFLALLRERGVQWVILDGKGDWLTPNLAKLPQMLIPPAGGYGEDGQQRIREAIATINAEAKRRFGLLLDAGVRSVEEYNQIAAEPLPLLIVLATDIIDVVDETERLLIALVSKARALGIRVIVSMQTPTGKRLEWRMNLSTLIAGALVDGSQDAPALGVRDVKALRYRPSQLPPPPTQRGLFVVRHNNEQFVIRTPALAGDFDQLINEYNNSALLESLLAEAVTTQYINNTKASVVTVDEQKSVPTLADALERIEGARSALRSFGTDVIPSQRAGKPQTPSVPVPALADALGQNEEADLALQSAGTASVPSPSPTVPVPDRPEAAKIGQIGGIFSGDGDGDSGDDALLAALAALQRAGLSREQARALGARFRNDEWTRAARLLREKDE
jgi:hypothetical protein